MARKVNKRFLILLTAVLGAAFLALVALMVLRGRGDVTSLVAQGDHAVKAAQDAAAKKDLREVFTQYKLAKEYYTRASRIASRDYELSVKLGDVLHELTAFDLDEVGKDIGAWERAAEVKPDHLPALRRLLDGYIDASELDTRAELLTRLQQKAAALAVADPKDLKARSWEQIAVIGIWLAGVSLDDGLAVPAPLFIRLLPLKEFPAQAGPALPSRSATALERLGAISRKPGDSSVVLPWPVVELLVEFADLVRQKPQDLKVPADQLAALAELAQLQKSASATAVPAQIARAIDELTRLQQQGGDDAVLPLWIARARFQLARTRIAAGDLDGPDGAQKQIADGVKAFDRPRKDHPDDPSVLYSCYQAKNEARRLLGSIRRLPENDDSLAELRRIIDHAAAKLPADHHDYVAIRLAAIDVATRMKDVPAAEKQVDELLALRPGDLQVRLAQAALVYYQPSRRAKAINDLVVLPDSDLVLYKGFRAHLRRSLELQRLLALVQLRLDAWTLATDEKERDLLREATEQDFARARAMARDPETPELLRFEGRIKLMRPDVDQNLLAASQLLQKAHDKLVQRNQPDPELAYLLANVYERLRETGRAASLLSSLVERFPQSHQIRKPLVILLLQQHDYEKAAQHLDILEKLVKDDQDVARLRIRLLRETGKTDEARQLVQALPQANEQQQLRKAVSLMSLEDFKAAEALLVPLSAAELEKGQGEFPASVALANLFERTARKPDAERIAQQAVAKNPNSTAWKVVQARLAGKSTPEQIQDIIRAGADRTLTGPDAALVTYQRLIRENRIDEALAHVQAAEKQYPNSGEIIEQIYRHALVAQKWDLAQQYVTRLERLNWDQVGGLYYRAQYLLARQDIAAATQACVELTQKQKDLSRNWLLRAKANHLGRQFAEARDAYLKTLEGQPANVEALRGLVECYLALNQSPLARKYLAEGARLTGADAAWFIETAKRLVETENPAAVLAQRELDVRERPEDPAARIALAQNYTLVGYQVVQQKNDQKAAMEYMEKALATLLEALKKWPDDSTLRQAAAASALRIGKKDIALATLQEWVARDAWKDRYEPLLALAACHERLGDIPRARETMLAAVSRSKGDIEVRKQLVALLMRAGQDDQAVAELASMVEQTRDPNLRQMLVEVQARAGKLDEAERWVKSGLAEKPQDHTLLALHAYVMIKRKDFAAASRLLEQSLAAHPQHEYAQALFLRGQIAMEQRQYARAAQDLRRAVDLAPRNVDWRMVLAELLRRSGNADQAASELEAAVQQAPDRVEPRQMLVDLYFREKRWSQVERILQEAHAGAESSLWHKREAQMWMERKDLDKALRSILAATQMNSSDLEAISLCLDILLLRKDYPDTIKVADRIIAAMQAQNVRIPFWIHMVRGVAFRGMGMTPDAEKAFDTALSVAETDNDQAASLLTRRLMDTMGVQWTANRLGARRDPRWAVLTMHVHARAGDLRKAADTAEDLLRQVPNLAPAKRLEVLGSVATFYLGIAARDAASVEKAERVYFLYLKEVEQQKLDDAYQIGALNNLACLFAEHPVSPDLAKALLYARRARELSEKTGRVEPTVIDTYAWVLILSNRVDEGMALLRELPNPPADALYHLGEASLRKAAAGDAPRNMEEARRYLGEALRLLREDEQNQAVDASLRSKIEAALKKAGAVAGQDAAGQ